MSIMSSRWLGSCVHRLTSVLYWAESGVSGDRKRRRPIVVDQSRLSEFTIYDVVLPLPGFDVIYPENEGAAS